MSTPTTNYGFTKPNMTDYAKITDINGTFDQIDTTIKTIADQRIVQTAGGNATAITLTLPTLTNGYQVTFKAAYGNNSSATTINTINAYKDGTSTPPNFIAKKTYTVYYDTSGSTPCFFVKASASGTAGTADVLATKTFSNDNDTNLAGGMTNNGAVVITPSTSNQAIPLGYHNGSGYAKGEPNLVSANIRAGITMYNVAGKASVVDTSDATATAAYLLSGVSAYVNGSKINGGIPITNPTYSDQLEISSIVVGPDSYGNGANYAYMAVPKNSYLNGIDWVFHYEPNLYAQNIVSGNTIMGVGGSATIQSLGGRLYANSTFSFPNGGSGGNTTTMNVSLPFTPSQVIVIWPCAGRTIRAIKTSSDTSNLAINLDGSTVNYVNGITLITNGFNFNYTNYPAATATYYAYS